MPPYMPEWMLDQIRRSDFLGRARWNLKFCWLPHKCDFSGRMLWLKKAYRGVALWIGPGEPVVECRWVESQEYLMYKIKGGIK